MSTSSNEVRTGPALLVTGGVMVFLGLAIVLWPEKGWMPHPLTFPPSESARPIAGYAVMGYPLLGAGLLFTLAGGLRLILRAIVDR